MNLKRIGLFLLTNILVIVTISIVLNILGVGHYMTRYGMDYGNLAIFCLIWGMGGAVISLALSRMMAKWMMGVQVIDPRNPGAYLWLVNLVREQSTRAGLPTLPEIGVYNSPEVNAFATGPSQNRALVAFSSGLLSRMDKNEIAGVCAHELSHVKNGDMVTMTLIQGVINAFVMFVARVVAYLASQQVREENRGIVNFAVVMLLDILLSILASLVVFWFSRQREFRADAGAAKLAGRENMIAALSALKRLHGIGEDPEEHRSLATMKINGRSSWAQVFATHPSLDQRIEALRALQV